MSKVIGIMGELSGRYREIWAAAGDAGGSRDSTGFGRDRDGDADGSGRDAGMEGHVGSAGTGSIGGSGLGGIGSGSGIGGSGHGGIGLGGSGHGGSGLGGSGIGGIGDSGIGVSGLGGIRPGDPKVSRGENYRGLPWVMLDYPRVWGRADVLAIRTMFLWGHAFSVTLHLKGEYQRLFLPVILRRRAELAAAGFFVGVSEDEWRHEHTAEVFAPIGEAPGEAGGVGLGGSDIAAGGAELGGSDIATGGAGTGGSDIAAGGAELGGMGSAAAEGSAAAGASGKEGAAQGIGMSAGGKAGAGASGTTGSAAKPLGERPFLKLSAAVGLDRWSEAPVALAELFRVLVNVLGDGT